MIGKDANLLSWLQGLWPGKRLAETRREPELTLKLEHEDGCFLRFDRFGVLIDYGQYLASRMQISEEGGVLRLENVVAQMPLWLRGTPEQWPQQIPELILKGCNGQPLVLAGSLYAEAEHWLLRLVDISETHCRLQALERRRRFLDQARQSAALLKSGNGDSKLLLDWLKEQCLRLQVPAAAVLLKEEKEESDWQIFQHYARHGEGTAGNGTHILSPDLFNKLAQLAEQPLQWRDELDRLVWLIPYCEQHRVVACLYIEGLEASRQAGWLSANDWYQWFEYVADPLLRAQRKHSAWIVKQRYQTIASLVSGGWWEYFPASECLQLSPQLAERFGLDETACLLAAEQWLAMLAPQYREAFQLKLASARARHSSISQVVQLKNEKDGKAGAWYVFEGAALEQLREKEETSIVGFAFDISDTHHQEVEAEAAKARLQGLIDGVPGIIYMQRYAEGTFCIDFCSASLQDLLGWNQQEFRDGAFASFLHPDDRDVYFDTMKLLLQSGRVGQQYRMQCKEGGYRWMQAESRLLRDEQGLPQEVVGVCLDITENKEAVERVYKSEENYRALVEDSPAIICRYTSDLGITFANGMLASALNVEQDVVNDLNLGDYMSTEVRKQALQRIADLSPEHPYVTTEICICRGQQDYRWWVLFESGVFDAAGRLLEVQAVGRDNTELHQTRNQLIHSAKMATMGEMATGLAHEINQPLNVIHMSLTNLLSHIRKGNAEESYIINKVERVAEQVQRAAGIIDHVRVFGRQSDIEGMRFNPGAAVEGALSLLREKLQKDNIHLHEKLEAVPDVVGHADRLEQVLMNLIMNASYAVKEQSQKVVGLQPEISIAVRATDDGHVTLSVKDNGGGVDESLLDRVFEPFFTTKPFGEGTGLGLSLSYAIVKQMSGQLVVENDKDGAVFSIVLPVAVLYQKSEGLGEHN